MHSKQNKINNQELKCLSQLSHHAHCPNLPWEAWQEEAGETLLVTEQLYSEEDAVKLTHDLNDAAAGKICFSCMESHTTPHQFRICIAQKVLDQYLEKNEKPTIMDSAAYSLYFKLHGNEVESWKNKNLIHGHCSREKPLFKDEVMPILWEEIIKNNQQMLEEIATLDGLGSIIGNAMSVRHRYFNQSLAHALNDPMMPVKQVVILGSGYDTRPVIKSRDGVTFYEIDYDQTIDKKNFYYHNRKIKNNAVVIGMDYANSDLMSELCKNGFSTSLPTHILWEGNMVYLPMEVVKHILHTFKTNMRAAFSISFDYYNLSALSKIHAKALIGKMASAANHFSSGFRSGIDNIRQFTDEVGYELYDNLSLKDLITKYGLDDEPDPYLENYACCTLKCFPILKFSYVQRGRITYKLAETPEEFAECLRVRNSVYYAINHVEMPPDEEDLPQRIIMAKIGDEIIAGMRFVISSKCDHIKLPLEHHDFNVLEVYPELASHSYCEWGRTFVKPEFAGADIILNLFAIANEICLKFGCTDVFGLSPVRVAEHYKLIARELAFEYVMTGHDTHVQSDKGEDIRLVFGRGQLAKNIVEHFEGSYQMVHIPRQG